MNLTHKAETRIAELSSFLESLPGVVIIHYINSQSVLYMSPNGLKILGVSLKELQNMGTEYHERFFNAEEAADYVPKILGMIERNNDDELVSFFQQVKNKDQKWEWYASGTRIFMRDNEGLPYLTITVAIPIDVKHYFSNKIERLFKENELLRKNRDIMKLLTKREKELLALMAKDISSKDIAATLHISEDTVKTHRKNIKKKLGLQSQYDIVKISEAFDLV